MSAAAPAGRLLVHRLLRVPRVRRREPDLCEPALRGLLERLQVGPAPERRPRRRHDQRHEPRAPRGDQRRASQRLVQRLSPGTRARTSAPGTSAPSSAAARAPQYNQVINSHNYYLQQEWSNDGSTCLLRYGSGGPPPAPTVTSFNPTSGPVGTNVSITGHELHRRDRGEVQRDVGTTFTFNSRHERERDGAERRRDRPDRRHDAERHRHERDQLHRHRRWWWQPAHGERRSARRAVRSGRTSRSPAPASPACPR